MPFNKSSLVMMLALVAPLGASADSPCVTATTASYTASQPKLAYLGANFGRVVPPVAAQLPREIVRGTGVVITNVSVNSPAMQGGLRRYDVVAAINGIPILDPRQVGVIIRQNPPGGKLKFTIARRGALKDIAVELGSMPQPPQPHMVNSGEQISFKSFTQSAKQNAAPGKENGASASVSFNAVAVETDDGTHYRAKLEFTDAGGDHKVQFKGTREEIARDLASRKDIPTTEKARLMKALGAS